MNFKINKGVDKDKFKGPAIYVIEFKGEVIYIKKYRPEDKRLISLRWVKHIMTFTNRGYRVGEVFKKLVLEQNKFAIFKQNKKFFEDIYRYFKTENKTRFEDTGTLTSFNRLRFADKYSKFNSHKVDISDFTFNCFTLSGDEKNLQKERISK